MKKENFPQSSGTESFIFSSCVESTADCSLSEGCRALCWLSSIHAWWRMRRRRVMIFFISLRQVMRLHSTMIYRWVNSGQEPIAALPHICILGGQFFFGLRDESEPTAPANEDLVGTNSFQECWLCASACVGRREKKNKKKHRGPSKCDKTKRISTFCLPTCVLKSLRESGPSSCQLQVSLWGWVHACVCFPGKIVFLAWPTG